MLNIESQPAVIHCPIDHVYRFVSDFRNFDRFMPSLINDYQSTRESCRFSVSSLGEISLAIKESVEPTYLLASSLPDSAFDFEIAIRLLNDDNKGTQAVGFVKAKLGVLMAVAAKGYLQQFADALIQKLKEVCENSCDQSAGTLT